MDKKRLKERIKKFAENRLKEMSTGAGATSGFQTGTGYQHQGKKPKNETILNIYIFFQTTCCKITNILLNLA